MIKKFMAITLAFLIVSFSLLYPASLTAEAASANSVNDLKSELSNLEAEKAANDRAKSQTQGEINQKKNNIYNAYQEQVANEGKVTEAEASIVASNEEIKVKTKESADLFRFLQMVEGENIYLEYILKAKTPKDLVVRTAIVEQLTKYNQEKTNELNALIKKNEELKVQLAARNQELEQQKIVYQKAVASLGNRLSDLNEINADYADQIKMKRELIKYYQSVCKSDDQPLTECVGSFADISFLRPVNKGRVSSSWGYRIHPISHTRSFHNAIDIADNKEGTPVFATANGLVAGITKRASCGGNSVFIHHIVNGKYYTSQYTHLLSYSVKVGDIVTKFTQIGTVGGGAQTKTYDGCTTGAHLHFGIAGGHYLGSGSQGYTSWSKYVAQSVNPLNYLPGGSSSWRARG